jgi:hypothetical protein
MIHEQPLVDHGLPTLSEVLDPVALAKHLGLVSGAPWNGGVVEDIRVRVLKHHEGERCTLEIGLRAGNTRYFLIGKIYNNDQPEVFRAMKEIQAAGFGPQEEFSIPQPFAYLPSLRLLLLEKVEGPAAKEIFKDGDECKRAAAAERSARWLARFQALAPKTGPVFDVQDWLDSLQKRSHQIGKLSERCADKAARLIQQLQDASLLLGSVEMRPGHGSYSPAQLILPDSRTVAIDWDGYDLADPARDVGRFLYALRRWAVDKLGSIRALDRTAEVFLEIYRSSAPSGAETNLWFYKAASCLKLARTVPHWREKAEAMLDEGLRVLEAEAPR